MNAVVCLAALITALAAPAQLMRTRADNNKSGTDKSAELSFTIRRNLFYWRKGPLLGSNWTGANFVLDSNLYWNVAGRPITFKDATLAQWQAKGFDKNSLVANPLFVAPERGDFSLRPAPIVDDWENDVLGAKPGGALVLLGEEAGVPDATIRVSDETAASGTHSLKFSDAAGQKNRYNPHLFYKPRLTTGTVTGRFALRVEPGAVVVHEWRDAATPLHVGPSLRIDGAGVLWAANKRLAELPQSRWLRFEIMCELGDLAKGTYALTVRLPGRVPPLRFVGLPCSPAAFTSLRWWGFMADANATAVFFLDDVRLEPGAPR